MVSLALWVLLLCDAVETGADVPLAVFVVLVVCAVHDAVEELQIVSACLGKRKEREGGGRGKVGEEREGGGRGKGRGGEGGRGKVGEEREGGGRGKAGEEREGGGRGKVGEERDGGGRGKVGRERREGYKVGEERREG